jgi:DNA-binding SARP family transcriptional activator
MEEIERAECAIEHFEALLEERTEDRELITDALLRLIKLYEKAGDDEAVKGVMRRFWEAGAASCGAVTCRTRPASCRPTSTCWRSPTCRG